jgi:hypothetical protein
MILVLAAAVISGLVGVSGTPRHLGHRLKTP